MGLWQAKGDARSKKPGETYSEHLKAMQDAIAHERVIRRNGASQPGGPPPDTNANLPEKFHHTVGETPKQVAMTLFCTFA